MKEFNVGGSWVSCGDTFWLMAPSALDAAPPMGEMFQVSSFANRGFGTSRVLGLINTNPDSDMILLSSFYSSSANLHFLAWVNDRRDMISFQDQVPAYRTAMLPQCYRDVTVTLLSCYHAAPRLVIHTS